MAFNNSLLSNVDFKNILKRVIVDFKLKIPEFVSLRDWWDSLKIAIRKATVNFSVRERRLQNQNRIVLTKHLIRAKNSSQPSAVIDDLEGQLSALISKEAEGAKIRSCAQWFEEGEKPTRYFFILSGLIQFLILFLLFLTKMALRKLHSKIWKIS